MSENIEKYIEEQRAVISKNDIELFLRRMFNLFYEFGKSPALQGRHITSPEFDALCREAGQRSAFELRGPFLPVPSRAHHIIVLTEIMVQGGHAELVKDIIRTSELPILLVVTNINGRVEPVLEKLRDEENILDIVVASETTFLGKLQTVQAVLANPGARKIFLIAHGYDAVAVSAVSPELSAKTYYLHHCDHYPALGCYLPGVRHIDLHNLGFNRCRNENNIHDNRYLCLTSTSLSAPTGNKAFSSTCFISATCGGGHKLHGISYHLEYKDVVLNILKRRNGVHYHLGRLSPEFLADMAGALEQQGLNSDQFCYLGEASNLAEILTQLEVDLYIPTLPQSGGKALIDAMAAGVPILLHQNARDRLWSSVDLVYPEAPSWKNFEELNDILDCFDAEFWAVQAKASRSYFERFHSKAMFAKQLSRGGVEHESDDIPKLKVFNPDVSSYLRFAGFRQS